MASHEATARTCDLLDRHLDDILDGDTAGRGAALTRNDALSHVPACPRCRPKHGALISFLRQVAAGPDVPLPAGAHSPIAAEAWHPIIRWRGLTRVAAAILMLAGAALWWQSQPAAPRPEAARATHESVVFAPLQRLTPIRIERRERVVEWRPAGVNRAEYRTFTATCLGTSALARIEEERQ